MFVPKTERIKKLAEKYEKVIKELENIFDKETFVYIDFANVIHWQDKLKWHICIKRLKQLLDSFDTIKGIKIYYGTLENNSNSLEMIDSIKNSGYDLRTKPVKIIKKSIDVSSIDMGSPTLLKNFVKKSFLTKLKIETIEAINKDLRELNKNNIFYIEDEKCNFDVEIGIDMLLDGEDGAINNFILWSGDSDFAFPVKDLLVRNKKVLLFTIARMAGPELMETGVRVFDVRKIRDFICWTREISILL